MQRQNEREERALKEMELRVYNPLRIIWSTIMNRHRNGKLEKVYKPSDLFKLSIDGKEEEKPKEVNIKKVIQRIGKIFKKNGSE